MSLKACFAISNPIVLTSAMDASSSGVLTPPLWHIDVVGGASTPSKPLTGTPRRHYVTKAHHFVGIAGRQLNARECDDRMNRATLQNSTPIINDPAKDA
jgi:hypothetical protein